MHTREITNGKSNIILHYNSTKGGTDCFDQLCHSYTVTRRTNRWPMRVFFGMLDQAIVNARILWKCKQEATNMRVPSTAIICLEKIYIDLITPYLSQRYETVTLCKDLKIGIAAILNKDIQDLPYKRNHLAKRLRCAFCERQDDRKTNEI